jgi:hypothetical protein
MPLPTRPCAFSNKRRRAWQRFLPGGHAGVPWGRCPRSPGESLSGHPPRRKSSLADHALLPRPVTGPHRLLVDLANGGQRQPIDELDALWRMRGTLAVLDELDEARGRRLRSGSRHDKRTDRLAPFGVGDADDARMATSG